MMVHFSGQIRKYGNSHVVTIPAAYVENGLVDSDKTYRFEITEEVSDDQR